jgi:hypothetical protein
MGADPMPAGQASRVGALSQRSMQGANSRLRSHVHRGSISRENKNTVARKCTAAMAAQPNPKEVAMCFEFEYLYWAKLEEEARQRKEEEEARRQAAPGAAPKQPQPQQHDSVPV